MANVNENWNFQVIMFNNVITCGVNYEKLDFDYMYIFFGPLQFSKRYDSSVLPSKTFNKWNYKCVLFTNVKANNLHE